MTSQVFTQATRRTQAFACVQSYRDVVICQVSPKSVRGIGATGVQNLAILITLDNLTYFLQQLVYYRTSRETRQTSKVGVKFVSVIL